MAAGGNFFGIKEKPKKNAFTYPDAIKMPDENCSENTGTEIIPFDYENLNKEIIPVRTVIINEEPWWVANDVCMVLGIEDVSKTISRLRSNYEEIQIDTDGVLSKHPIPDTLGRPQKTTIISEEGLYALIFRSRKKEALKFQHWVTSKVLPSIRKTGAYVHPERAQT